jgi:hypothetical protein
MEDSEVVVLNRPDGVWVTKEEHSTSSGGSTDVTDAASPKPLPSNAVFRAVNSLYDDELRPNLGLVRRRLKELYDVLVPITDLRKLVQSLVKAEVIHMDGDPQEPVLTLNARPAGCFIDPMDPDLPYDPGIFQRLRALMEAATVSDPRRMYKGGRYGMAQQLRSAEMPELQAFSLGRVCHIVQHAIGKKIVGYRKGGALVPYRLSDTFLKSASQLADASELVDDLPPIKTLPELRAVLTVLWMNPENHQGLPLSLVKDKIKQSARRSLSEHLLGFGKLSQLFTIPELEGCCELRRDEPFDPFLCPPSLLTAGEVPSAKNAGLAAQKSARQKSGHTSPAAAPVAAPAELPFLPPLMGPVPAGNQWMFAAMMPMALAMAQAQQESLGAGAGLPVPSDLLLSLGPPEATAKTAPPSVVPPGAAWLRHGRRQDADV